MHEVFVVDEDAIGLAHDLNEIAKRESQGIGFVPFTTPEPAFAEIDSRRPHLVLIHHHWNGFKINEILERLRTLDDKIRIVVFTGQPIDVRELIECVRAGAADYWPERGKLEPVWMVRRIGQYCSSSAWSAGKLGMSSESVIKLLSAAESTLKQNETLESRNRGLTATISGLESQEGATLRRAAISIIKFVGVASVLVTSFYVAKTIAFGQWEALAVVVVIAICCLLLEGRLGEAAVKWAGGGATFKAPVVNTGSSSARDKRKRADIGGA
jgi:DNA-binding NarL/FixJ family response regulator